MTTPSITPEPGDFELVEAEVSLSCGKRVTVREMTLRQRDLVAAQLRDLSADEDLQRFLEPFFAEPAEGGKKDVEVDVATLVKMAAARIGDGALTRFLVTATLDTPENRKADLFDGLSAEEWALDNIRLRDETALLRAWTDANDVGKYLGNLLGLLSLGARVQKKGAEA